MDVLIIAGFLGAGKTTFIRNLSERTDKQLVVLENEYAAINVDEDILSKEADLDVWEMTERCACCTGKADLAENILTIAGSVEPDVLIVEPTGVGYLSRVIENIQKVEYERIRLLAPVTIIDPGSLDHYLAAYGDLFKDQIRYAGTIIISKCDRPLDIKVDDIESTLRNLGASGVILKTHYSRQRDSFWQELLGRRLDGSIDAPVEASDEVAFVSLSIEQAAMRSIGEFVLLMEEILRGKYGKILRAKGTLGTEAGRLRVNLSGGQYCIEEAPDDAKPGMVFIGEFVDEDALRLLLELDNAAERANYDRCCV